MIDELTGVVASCIVGIAGGFLSSWMAFNASGDTFNPRKHGNALIIGALSGLGLGATSAVLNPDISIGQFVLTLVFTLLSAVGLDRLRSNGSQMITNNTGVGAPFNTGGSSPSLPDPNP